MAAAANDEAAAASEEDSHADEDESFGPAPNVDIDAIASAKSLGEAMRLLAPQLTGLPRRSRGKYGKRKHLSAEEKAELTRRRNRENARSTRLRRKLYIQHMQDVAATLKERHDELTAKMNAPPPDGYSRQREAARRFFALRGACEQNLDRWLEVVANDVQLGLPPEPYRRCQNDGDDDAAQQRHCRRAVGAAALVADCQSLQTFLSDLAAERAAALAREENASAGSNNNSVSLVFHVDPGTIVHVGKRYMCQWSAKIAVVEHDLEVSVSHSGMARCGFTDQNTIGEVDLRFDVPAFMAAIDDFLAARPPPPPQEQQQQAPAAPPATPSSSSS